MGKQADHLDWEFIQAVHFGRGRPVPITAGVDHFTAGGSGRAVAKWVAGLSFYKGKKVPAAKACGTILTCRDGHIIQQVSLKDRAYHAGTKAGRGDLWKGAEPLRNVNDFTVGIENSNYGWLIRYQGAFYVPRRQKDGSWGRGTRYPSKLGEPIAAPDHRGALRYWEPYTDELVEANISVKKALLEMGHVTDRGNWQGHSDVSPDRKTDPGPLWPIDYILDQAFGHDLLTEPFVVQGGEDPGETESDMAIFRGRRDADLAEHYDEDAEMCLIDEEDS